jgi:hypothetical protein
MSSSSKVFKCSQCSFVTIRKDSLKRHEKVHGGDFRCLACDGIFKTIGTLGAHVKACINGTYAERESLNVDPEESKTSSTKDPEMEEIENELLASLKAITEESEEDILSELIKI